MNGVEVGIMFSFLAGLLSFLSPCVLPLVPSYLTFVTGMSLEDLEQGVDRRATLIHSVLFVTGFSLIFIILGAAASFLGQFFEYWDEWITEWISVERRFTPCSRSSRLMPVTNVR